MGLILSTHADKQGVDISVIVCLFVCVCWFFCVFVRLRISLPRIKLAASNSARRYISIQDRKSPIFVNIVPPKAPNRTNWRARGPRPRRVHYDYPLASEHMTDVGSACVDICQSHWRKFLLLSLSYKVKWDVLLMHELAYCLRSAALLKHSGVGPVWGIQQRG